MSNIKPDYSYLNPHESVYSHIAALSYRDARRWLKSLWLTRGEQSEIIRRTKNHEGKLKESLSPYWFEKDIDKNSDLE